MKFELGEEQVVKDIRGCSDDITWLDTSGFTVVEHDTKVQNFADAALIEDVYLTEVEDLLRATFDGAQSIIIFDWRVGVSSKRNNFKEAKGPDSQKYYSATR